MKIRKEIITPSKTYKTEANADKAVEALFGNTNLRYFVMTGPDGRFFPVFIGVEAVNFGVHFHFNVVG